MHVLDLSIANLYKTTPTVDRSTKHLRIALWQRSWKCHRPRIKTPSKWMEITISDKVIVRKTNKCAKHFSSVSLAVFLSSFIPFRVASFYFCFNLLLAVDEWWPPPTMKKWLQDDDATDAKGTENRNFATTIKMVGKRKSESRRWADGEWSVEWQQRFMPQKKINDMLNGNKSQCEIGTVHS